MTQPPDDLSDDLAGRFAAARAPQRRPLDAEHARGNLRARLFGAPSMRTGLGPHTIVRVLGRGGMGTVFEGRTPAGRAVALKILQRPEPAAILRFKQEFRSVADVGHRNLAAVEELAFDAAQGEWYLAMEYVPGVRWIDHVRPGDAAADPAIVRDALAQLAAGVRALHGAGVLHRDLKPSNVLVAPDGRVKIVDFGLAELLAARDGRAAGTAGYVAPELARGAAPSPASDWYAVGVMLHRALSGRFPAPAPALPPDAPPDLAALCLDLLEPRPEDRPRGDDVLRRLGLHPAPTPLPAAFVGRAAELAACADHLAAAPALVLLVGPSGAGKSALLARLLEGLRAPGALVLAARCHEGESVPHNALDGVVDALARHLAACPSGHVPSLLPDETQALVRLFPALARVRALAVDVGPATDPREARRRALAGLRRLLGGLASAGPLVLAVDDLQWGDADSARLLADLLAPPDPPPLRLVATVRADARAGSPFFLELAAADLACPIAEVVVDPLAEADARALAAALLGDGDPETAALAASIARQSAGSPLLIEAMARRRSAADGPGEALRAQIAELDDTARAALARLAVAGRPLPRELALPDSLAPLRAGRLVRAGGDRDTVEVYHDLVRAVVLRDLPDPDRRGHHRALAEALAAAPDPDPDELAHHFHGAGDLRRAGAFALQAAERAAAALAFARAAELYGKVLSWGTCPPEHVFEVTLARADALVHAGRCGEAAPVYLSAAAQAAERRRELALRGRAAELYLVSGRVEAGLVLLAPLARELGLPSPGGSGATLARFLLERVRLALARRRPAPERPPGAVAPLDALRIDTCWSAGKGLGFIDPTRAAVFATHGMTLALAAGDPRRIARAGAYLALMDVNDPAPARAAAGRRAIEAAAAVAERLADAHLGGLTTILGGVAAMNHGAWRRALRLVDDGAAHLRRGAVADDTWERGIAHSMAMHAHLMLGEFPAMLARADRMRRDAEDTGDRFAAVVAILYVAHAALADGDPAGARAHVRKALSMWTYDGFSFQHWLALGVEVACDLYQQRGRAAWQRVERAWPALGRSQLMRMQIPRIDAHLLRASAALAAGDPTLRRTAEREASALAAEPIALAAAARDLIHAQLAAVRRDPAAPARLAAAADRLARADTPALAAAVHLAAARRDGRDHEDPARVLARCGVRDPRRWAATVAPGLYDLSS